MVRWRTLFIPFVAACLSTAFVSLGFWDGTKQAILVSLSVIAAGVLVRLARGFPFTNLDHYEVDEIRQLATAIKQISRSLAALIKVVLAAMLLIAIAKPTTDFIVHLSAGWSTNDYIERAVSGLLGLIIGYVFIRMKQVVKGDFDLTQMQSNFVVRAVERNQSKRFEELEKKGSDKPFKNPEGYGKIIQ